MTDVLGQAISDHYYNNNTSKLWIHNQYGSKEEMPVSIYFRQKNEIPFLEKLALDHCTGKILDIGAGAGSHALILQQHKKDITALEISGLACKVMNARGVKKIIEQNIWLHQQYTYDTLLLLMNGIGITQTIDGFHRFLQHAATLLNKDGQLIFDSSDVTYLYEDGFPYPSAGYYGEIDYQYQYKRKKTDWFKWLYIDKTTLSAIAEAEGWQYEFLTEDENGQYLVKLKRVKK